MLPPLPRGYQFSSNLLRGLKLDKTTLGYEDLQMATFETINTGRRQNTFGGSRGWVPQINHLQEYRE